MQKQSRSRVSVLLSITTMAVVAMLVGEQSPIKAAQSRFVGGDPTRPDSADMRALRLRFEAGARSNWHSHAGWQIIAAEEGRGRTQVRGEEIIELLPGGPPNYTAPDVVHWHGAAPDEHVVQMTFMGGASGADWFEPVSDAEYRGRQVVIVERRLATTVSPSVSTAVQVRIRRDATAQSGNEPIGVLIWIRLLGQDGTVKVLVSPANTGIARHERCLGRAFQGPFSHQYVVSSDGQRFLMNTVISRRATTS